jgi:hypothetical protein
MATFDKDQVVVELAKRFPDADPGPAGLWGFINAGWDGDVGEEGLDDWAAAWEDACAATERGE